MTIAASSEIINSLSLNHRDQGTISFHVPNTKTSLRVTLDVEVQDHRFISVFLKNARFQVESYIREKGPDRRLAADSKDPWLDESPYLFLELRIGSTSFREDGLTWGRVHEVIMGLEYLLIDEERFQLAPDIKIFKFPSKVRVGDGWLRFIPHGRQFEKDSITT